MLPQQQVMWRAPSSGCSVRRPVPSPSNCSSPQLRGYVAQRRDMTDYPRFRRRGWDIGSGPTEAGGKDLAARVRGVGMKWDLDHAADLMNLKALYESDQATAYWKAQAGVPSLN